VVRGDLATPLLWRWLDVPAHVPDAAAHHAAVLHCLSAGTPPGPGFTTPEVNHLHDVAAVLTRIRLAGLAALAVLVLLAATRAAPAWTALRDGARLGFALATAIALLGLQWSFAFRAVHPLLFPCADSADDAWDFPPDALLVRLYPDAYFGGVLALVLALWLALLGAGWLADRHRRGPGAPRPWGWTRAHAAAALLAALALPLWAAAGYHLCNWQGPAAWTADAVLLGLLLGALGAWFAPRRATALLAFGAGLSAWLALGAGVDLAGAEASRVTRRGDAVIAAIAAYRNTHGRLPITLDDLIPASLPALPGVTVGSGTWYYERDPRDHDRYWLGFQGPLAWMYEYDSARGTWNLPEGERGHA
jgi:hypothetical protein